jgi:rhamnogalacturonan endolyase
MTNTRSRALVPVLALVLAASAAGVQARPARADTVSLAVSGMTATMANGSYTIRFDSSGTARSLVWGGRELIGPARGFYSSINGGTAFSPTSLKVVASTPAMADIAYVSSWGELHYVTRAGVSGLYSYFVATGIGTVGEFRTLYRVDGSIFRNGFNAERSGSFPTLAQIKAATVLQNETFRLSDGTVYTKYDMASYVGQDHVHGVFGSGAGVWLIPASREYYNGGPMKQELMVHVESATGDGVVLNMLAATHFGNPNVAIPSGKVFGPWLVYFNSGTSADAVSRAAVEEASWPYSWLSNPGYPLSRTTVSGRLVLADGRPAAGAMVTMAAPGGNLYAQGSGYMFSSQADAGGNFMVPKVRPGSYALYAFSTGGSLGNVTDQFERDGLTVSGGSENLGTLTWSPPTHAHALWQIGTADRTAAELRFGSLPRQYGLWNQVPANLTYTIGSSTPASGWYYAQTQVGTWTVAFNLGSAPSGNAFLTIAVAGATRNPALAVGVNGATVATFSFGTDMATYRDANRSGAYQLEQVAFPASRLRPGANTVTLRLTGVTSGGGIMYDTVKLDSD